MLKFYEGKLGDDNSKYLYRCYTIEFCDVPIVGDIVQLPPSEEDAPFYKIKCRVVVDDSIEYFCELYDWED